MVSMSLLKILLCAAIAWGGYKYFVDSRAASDQLSTPHQAAYVHVHNDPNIPFVRMPTPSGHNPLGVVVFAPANCSAGVAQHADDMVRRLQEKGIPAARTNVGDFSADGLSPEEVQNLQRVMEGGIPAVFVNGTGKANPSFEEVVAQYRGTK
jgi:hypothetical protein